MKAINPDAISITVETQYLGHPIAPNEDQYAFAYRITISNRSDEVVQLMSRHWIIRDADNHVQEVHGAGVVGQTPVIAPGQSFTYSSGAVVKTPVGTMQGSYQFIDSQHQPFEVPIPVFRLAVEAVLH